MEHKLVSAIDGKALNRNRKQKNVARAQQVHTETYISNSISQSYNYYFYRLYKYIHKTPC